MSDTICPDCGAPHPASKPCSAALLDERVDEWISEPPALPDGAVEVLRWQDARGNWSACDSEGVEWLWFVLPLPGRWAGAGAADVSRRLAAELAACRARRDEGDGEAWQLLVDAAEQAAVDLDVLVSDCAGMKTNEHERYLRLRQQVRTTKALAAKCAAVLLARRATATTATPTGEMK